MMRNESLVVWLRRRAFACAGLSLIVAGSAHAQLSAPTGTVYTQHGIYSWSGASANPIFNIPGNGFMLSPGSGYPVVTGNIPISSFATPFVVGPVADWITTPNPLFPTFGGARTTIGGFSTGNAAGLVWSNYIVGDRTPPTFQGGSYNISGGDITGVVGPLGWTGRVGMVFPFRVVARKGWGYGAMGAVFEIEIYNQLNQLQSVFDLGVIMATDGVGPRPDGLAWFYNNIFNGPAPGALTLGGVFNQIVVPGAVYAANGWVGILTPQLTLAPGWKWVIQGRLTLLMDPQDGDMEIDYSQIPSNFSPDLGYSVVPEPFSLTALSAGLLGLLFRRRRAA
jgi:hypothetical protein